MARIIQAGKTFSRLLLAVLAAAVIYLWWQWDRLALMQPIPEPWSPPISAAPDTTPAEREECRDNYPQRRAWFGDLHVHTAYSFDARSRDMLGSVEDAYRFARGETIYLGPFDAAGRGSRPAQLQRPLDFAAVTDHAEWIGEVRLCTTPESPAYNTKSCRIYRGEIADDSLVSTYITGGQGNRMIAVINSLGRKSEICGEGDRVCRDSLKSAWEHNQQATEAYYDRSADCSFTSFHGYEHSYSPGRSKVHRNVIFRNELVPELPISALEETDPFQLWERLDALCSQASTACEALSIPHNSNVSNGRMFRIPWRGEPEAEQRRKASLRARWEPLVEMMQVKGESECARGLWNVFGEDELCDFEKIREMNELALGDCEDDYGTGAITGNSCRSRLDFARYALLEGMAEKQRIGVNPYQFGFIGSTDNHNAAPGDVDEGNYRGCCATGDDTPAARLSADRDFAGSPIAARNPGGLMGAWAERNDRDTLFDAMQRREVFATSGPRIQPRLFAGEDFPTDACDGDIAEVGYRDGVSMGEELELRGSGAPDFLVAASADPEGNPLQRLQVVKVWLGEDNEFHQRVFDVAGSADNGAAVDLESCEASGPQSRQLCASWADPSWGETGADTAGFTGSREAAYYLRVLENPSCRWSWRQCLEIPADQRPATCEDPNIAKLIQERAWTSPIWISAKDE